MAAIIHRDNMQKNTVQPTEGAARPIMLICLHWLTLAVMLAGISLVLVRELVEARGTRALLLQGHRWCGLLLLIICVARLLERLWLQIKRDGLHQSANVTAMMNLAAKSIHALLYLLLLAVPMLGWALSSAAGQDIDLFGLRIPALIAPDDDRADILAGWHHTAAWIFLGLIALHAAAALWHHFFLRDPVLSNMWLGRKRH